IRSDPRPNRSVLVDDGRAHGFLHPRGGHTQLVVDPLHRAFRGVAVDRRRVRQFGSRTQNGPEHVYSGPCVARTRKGRAEWTLSSVVAKHATRAPAGRCNGTIPNSTPPSVARPGSRVRTTKKHSRGSSPPVPSSWKRSPSRSSQPPRDRPPPPLALVGCCGRHRRDRLRTPG